MEDKKYKWITIQEVDSSPSGKTKIYEVITNDTIVPILGVIKWQPTWRKYAFFPYGDSFYEEDCLKNIVEFLEELKLERKEMKNVKLCF
jgi:hypothetical protein